MEIREKGILNKCSWCWIIHHNLFGGDCTRALKGRRAEVPIDFEGNPLSVFISLNFKRKLSNSKWDITKIT